MRKCRPDELIDASSEEEEDDIIVLVSKEKPNVVWDGKLLSLLHFFDLDWARKQIPKEAVRTEEQAKAKMTKSDWNRIVNVTKRILEKVTKVLCPSERLALMESILPGTTEGYLPKELGPNQ